MNEKEYLTIRNKGYEYELNENNHEKAMAEFRKLDAYDDPKNGNYHPLELIGLDYSNGYGLPKNTEAAKECLLIACKHGDTWAMLHLGGIYEQEENYADAKKIYEKSLSLGNNSANVWIGLLYEYGRGVPVDYNKALNCYRTAEASGCINAKRRIADMYFNGHITE